MSPWVFCSLFQHIIGLLACVSPADAGRSGGGPDLSNMAAPLTTTCARLYNGRKVQIRNSGQMAPSEADLVRLPHGFSAGAERSGFSASPSTNTPRNSRRNATRWLLRKQTMNHWSGPVGWAEDAVHTCSGDHTYKPHTERVRTQNLRSPGGGGVQGGLDSTTDLQVLAGHAAV